MFSATSYVGTTRGPDTTIPNRRCCTGRQRMSLPSSRMLPAPGKRPAIARAARSCRRLSPPRWRISRAARYAVRQRAARSCRDAPPCRESRCCRRSSLSLAFPAFPHASQAQSLACPATRLAPVGRSSTFATTNVNAETSSMIMAVQLQITMVSIKVPVIETRPCSAGHFVFAAAATIGALPRRIHWRTSRGQYRCALQTSSLRPKSRRLLPYL